MLVENTVLERTTHPFQNNNSFDLGRMGKKNREPESDVPSRTAFSMQASFIFDLHHQDDACEDERNEICQRYREIIHQNTVEQPQQSSSRQH